MTKEQLELIIKAIKILNDSEEIDTTERITFKTIETKVKELYIKKVEESL